MNILTFIIIFSVSFFLIANDRVRIKRAYYNEAENLIDWEEMDISRMTAFLMSRKYKIIYIKKEI